MSVDRSQGRALVGFFGFMFAAFGSASAVSAPLTLSELNEFNVWVQCSEACGFLPPSPTFEQQRIYFQCASECGNSPRIWEKDGVAPTDRQDLELAILETQHAQQPPESPLVCYRGESGEVVVRGALCAEGVCEAQPVCTAQQCALPRTASLDCTEDEPGGPRCWWPSDVRPPSCPDVVCEARPDRGEASCGDADADGIPRWLEAATGRSDVQVDVACGGLTACALDQRCALEEELGLGQCTARACPRGECPLFHLEVVSEDDQQALVWVYFDHAALPTRVLDLYLTYDRRALALEDARPLPALSFFGKELNSAHLSDGTLRLSVFDTTSSDPIAQGPIIELVFRRTAESSGEIAFTEDAGLRQRALAPAQGDQQEALAQERWWGRGRRLTDRSALETRLALWFGFESVASPLSYAAVPDAEALCARIAACANEEDEVVRARMVSLLGRLQRGELSGAAAVEGVTANAVYLDGESGHLRMPVMLREPYDPGAQHFSFSTWFYTEGNTFNELRDSPQVLYTHNGFDERTRWGLLLRPEEEGEGARLIFFRGDLLSKTVPLAETVLAAQLPLREWHHVAFTLRADRGEVVLYFDGEEARRVTLPVPPTALSCPQLVNGVDVQLHEEGDVLGGRPTEYVYMGVARSGLYKVERMTLQGTGAEEVLGAGDRSFRDPDYSPVLDRIAYASDVSGSYEIWIARGDGSQAQQVTVGFGDAARGIRARRPRWAPDGTGLVFESNVYDVPNGDNTAGRVWHLYYVAYDPAEGVVRVPLTGGGAASQLIYQDHLRSQALNLYRLTHREQDRQHVQARWLEGTDAEADQRGVLVMETADRGFDDRRIEELTIATNIPASRFAPLSGLAAPGQEVELLAAHRSVRAAVPNPIEIRRLLFKRSQVRYEAEGQFQVEERAVEGGVEVVVSHAPTGYGARCWDRNANLVQDGDEDTNRDGRWEEADCYPSEVRGLLVEYDAAIYRPVLVDESGQYLSAGGLLAPQGEGGVNKELQLQDVYPEGRALVRVEVLSPYNALPIPAGEVAVLRFARRAQGAPEVGFGAFARVAQEEVLVKELNRETPPRAFDPAGRFDLLEEAQFSPDGEGLLLAAVSNARPLLLRSDSLSSASEAARVSRDELRLRGISWVRQDNYYACGWSGGYLHPFQKLVLSSLRGGLDDMKLHYGVRDPESLRSEVERGFERLDRESRRRAPSRLPSCELRNADCPEFHLCVEGECVMVDCDPEDPYSCQAFGGACVQRPVSVEQENTALDPESGLFDWVCSADCTSDRQCFTQECLNGPCRFCDVEREACVECRYAETDFGAFSLAGIEGCPDRNSFACVDGACVTDCYSFEDGESRYLCDPALEYCAQGRCVLLDWDWTDLAPASFVGLDDARPALPPQVWPGYSAAVGERFIVSLFAYGTEDLNHPPEVVVEVRGGPVFGGSWSRLGRVLVHNKTRAQGSSRPVVLESPFPFEDVRVRMITAPYQNVTGASTGLRDNEVEFCISDVMASARRRGEDPESVDLSACYRRAPGSVATLGYKLGVPIHEAIEACRARGHAGCPNLSRGELDYFREGSAAVVLTEVLVDGASIMGRLSQNTVCSYEGGLEPLDGERPRKLYYGDIQTERSNAQAALCARDPGACAAPTAAVLEFPAQERGFALLNCNLYDPQRPVEGSAQVVFSGVEVTREWPARGGAIVFDDGDNCRVEFDALRSAPCYEWDFDASLDPANAAEEPWATLEFGLFRGFGHDEGYTSLALPRWPLQVEVTGYTGSGLAVESRGERLEVVAGGEREVVSFAAEVPEGYSFAVRVASQPESASQRCAVVGEAGGRMPSGGARVRVSCLTRWPLSGEASGLAEGASAVLAVSSVDEAGLGEVRTFTVSSNGAFSLAPGVLGGASWSAQVLHQPRGQRCALSPAEGEQPAQGPTAGLRLVCEELPVYALGVAVLGLRGSGPLEVVERVSGQILSVTQIGRSDFAALVEVGSRYDIAVRSQPQDPAQLCVIQGGQAGEMPAAAHIGAQIVCSPQPTFAVTAPVVGLEGAGLRLSLNGMEEVEVARPGIGLEAPRVTFRRRLLAGESYQVRVVRQPEGPSQVCEVLFGEGVIEFSDTTDVQVHCRGRVSGQQYALRGTVSGLFGRDMILINGFGTERVEVDADGAFAFPSTVADGSDYAVTVDRQPREPAQLCRVLNGRGVVRGADVSDINVVCGEGSSITVSVDRPGSDGANVEVYVYSPLPEAALVGVSARGTKLEGGRASFVVQSAQGNGAAVLPQGEYDVFVFVNHDGSVDPNTGRDTWSVADYGSRRRATLRANSDNPVNFYGSDFSLLVAPGVRAQAALSIAPDAVLSCLYAPAGAGAVALPQGEGAPVVGRAVRSCEEGESCFARPTVFDNFRAATTDENQALPRGLYDLTCFGDEDGDGEVDSGEFYGVLFGVSAGSQAITITLQEVP